MKTTEGISLRGWEALKTKLEQNGLSSTEIEEASDSFCQGIEVLSRLFLSLYEAKNSSRASNNADNADK